MIRRRHLHRASEQEQEKKWDWLSHKQIVFAVSRQSTS